MTDIPITAAGKEYVPRTPPEARPDGELVVGAAVLRGTLTITRKATGKVETYELIGTVAPPPPDDNEAR
jgi:hypothetical protein